MRNIGVTVFKINEKDDLKTVLTSNFESWHHLLDFMLDAPVSLAVPNSS